MFTKFIALVPVTLLASSAFAWAPFEIKNPTVIGNCEAELRIEESQDGGYLVVADFTDLAAVADGSSARQYRYCTYKYDVDLEPGYVVRKIDTTVEGYYSITDGGKVIVGVENRAVGSSRTVAHRYLFNQPTDLANLEDVVGSIYRADLPSNSQVPGGTVSLNTKYTIEAANSSAASGVTDVRLTTATNGARSYPICKVYVDHP